jgi:1-deoxy-D-xylulose-5-phosphate synthase
VAHDVALQKLPVIFCLDEIWFGEDGATHHSVLTFATLNCIPNLMNLCSKDAIEVMKHNVYSTGLNHPNSNSLSKREKICRLENL